MSSLDEVDVAMLERELERPELQIYTACRMALEDLRSGLHSSAIARLRADADKLRCHETPLNNLLMRS